MPGRFSNLKIDSLFEVQSRVKVTPNGLKGSLYFILFYLFIHGMGHFIRHLGNENRTGAEMCPANVSGIATGDAPISYWSICFFVSNISPSSLKWRLKGSNGGTVVRIPPSTIVARVRSNLRGDAICGMRLLLVLSLAQGGFSPGTPVFPSPEKTGFSNSSSTRNGRRKTTHSCSS